MMGWSLFPYFAVPSAALWIAAAALVWRREKTPKRASGQTPTSSRGWRPAEWSMLAGTAVFAAFIVALWVGQARPPMRTMGETRLWYSFFLAVVGWAAYKRSGYRWMLTFAGAMAAMFAAINLARPEIHSEGLMPALQSVWFVPHVTVYMLSYAMMAAATIGACIQLAGRGDAKTAAFTDDVVRVGFGLLALGMLMGMVWAKEAWGHVWTWDPKETWALATCVAYLIYMHLRARLLWPRTALWMLVVAFLLLMTTWIGVNYLPAAGGSVHVY